MKKYIIMALLPFIFQGNIYCVDPKADLNKAIQQQLISARKVIGNVKLPLDLDPILVALVSYAKKGDNQSVEAINKMQDIGTALEQYRVDQYTTWTWYFGPTPAVVKDYIQPAIDKVTDNLKTIQNNAKSAGYTIAAAAAGTALAVVAAGIGAAAWYMFKPKSNLDADAGVAYHEQDFASPEKFAEIYARNTVEIIGGKTDIKDTVYRCVLNHVKSVENLHMYDSASGSYNKNEDDRLVQAVNQAIDEYERSQPLVV